LLYSSVDTVLYMYYGNSAVGNQEDAAGVWDGNYTMVQHLSETSGTHYDSTSFDNDATGFNGLDQDAAGKIDGCDDFDALDDYIDCGTSSSLNPGTGDYTIEAWVKRDNTGVNHVITSKRATYPGVGYLFWIQPDHSLRFYCEDASGNSASIIGGSIGDTSWHHVAVTLDRGGNGVIYTDGSAAVTTSIAGLTDSIDPSRLLTVGIQYQISGTSLPFNGSMDEVRVSNVARSSDWIDTGYNNYNNPGTFFSVGAEEYTPAPVVTSPIPSNGAVDVAITITDLSFILADHQGESMDYSVETSPDIGFDSDTGVGNNTYTVSVSGLAFDTVYTWFVNVTDGTYDSNKTFSFTTRPENYLPEVSNEMPSDDAVDVPVGTVMLSVDVSDRDAESMDVTFKTNESGSWQVINTNSSVGNGTYRQSHVFDSTGVLYYWSVNVSDTFGGWTNEIFSFTTERVWLENSWSYRKQFIVTENSGSTLTNYQVSVKVDYGSGEDSGDTVYVDGNSRSDFGDIRFTDATGLNEFDYWLESKTDGVEALFWVEIDSLPASSDTSLYLYYGNPTATTSSNGNNTFPMFDHFLGSDINSTLWEFLENAPDLIDYDVSGSIFSIWEKTVAGNDYGSLITNPALFTQNQALRFYTNMGVESNASEGARDIGGKKVHNNAGADINFEVIYCSFNTIPNFGGHATNGTAVNYMPFSDGWFDSWEVFEVRRDPSYCEFVHDGSGEALRESSLFYTANEYIVIHCCNTVKTMYVDWILLRNFVDPSPSVKAWGSEQVQLYPEVIDPSPVLGDVNVSLNPRLSVYVDDHDDDLQKITFFSNSSGSWTEIGNNVI